MTGKEAPSLQEHSAPSDWESKAPVDSCGLPGHHQPSHSCPLASVRRLSDCAAVTGGGRRSKRQPQAAEAAILIPCQTVKTTSVRSRFGWQSCLNLLTEGRSSHSKSAGPVNQAINFNLAHLSAAGLLTEPLCLRMQNEVREAAEPRGALMFTRGLN